MDPHSRQRARKRLDERFEPLHPIERFAPPPRGWVRAIRDAIGMTGAQLARRLGVTAQSVLDLERSEAAETVQLKTLRRAAEALDCTLVYTLVPRTSLDDAVHVRAQHLAASTLRRVAHSMALEDQAVREDQAEERLRRFVESAIRRRDLWED